MEFIHFKIALLLNSWLLAYSSPVAMLQQATSSQSIVFHQVQAARSAASTTTAPEMSESENQSKYEYKYEVSDHHTGDRKSHWERRDGDNVRGVYTLYEPDGALRTVEYTADSLHGFNAVVKRNEPMKHQHSQYNSGYKYKMTSSGGPDHSEESYRGYSVERDLFTTKSASKHEGQINSYNKGVDFKIVHEHNQK